MTSDPNQHPEGEYVESIGFEGEWKVVGPRAAPITYEDLLRVFEREYPPEMAAELAADLTPAQPGELWTTATLFAVAELSPEHADRISNYLGWTTTKLIQEIATFRKNPPDYNDRANRVVPPDDTQK